MQFTPFDEEDYWHCGTSTGCRTACTRQSFWMKHPGNY